MASPTLATLPRFSRKCQLDSLENLQALDKGPFDAPEVLRNVDLETLLSKLQSLDLTDLYILEAVTKADGMMTKSIGDTVHLSSKAALARARRLTGNKLLTCQSIPVRKGGIRPANQFFPAPGLTLKAIQEAITKSSQKTLGRKQEMEQAASPNNLDDFLLDPVDLLILSLVGRGVATTTRTIGERLKLTKSPTQRRLAELTESRLLIRTQMSPHAHRPGLKEYRYTLAPSIALEQVQAEISRINLSELPPYIRLDVFHLNSGLDTSQLEKSHIQNGHQSVSSTDTLGVKRLPQPNIPGMPENYISGFPVHSSSEGLSSLSSMEKLLHLMAERIAAHTKKISDLEERIIKLETDERNRLPLEVTNAILALIQPHNS